MEYLLLIAGFVLLIKGADFFVDGSSGIAKIFKVPSVIIGLTVVAMGTSMPEASVSITSGLAGKNELALSNIVGSNIFNLLFIIGLCAVIRTVPAGNEIRKRDLPVNLAISLLFLGLIADGMLSRTDAAILLVLFVAYIAWLVISALKNRVQGDDIAPIPLWKAILLIVLGLAAIIYGGNLVVDSASAIATAWGMSQNLVGLTIVAIGTSLPELATSFVAARKGENELALGNAVGSCIFNILFILGLSGVFSPIAANGENITDALVLIGVGGYFMMSYFCRKTMGRVNGSISLLLYVAYTAYIIMRNYGML